MTSFTILIAGNLNLLTSLKAIGKIIDG